MRSLEVILTADAPLCGRTGRYAFERNPDAAVLAGAVLATLDSREGGFDRAQLRLIAANRGMIHVDHDACRRFVAGIGNMRYSHFLAYNVAGAIIWVGTCVYAGYFFGNIPVVKQNFTLVVLGIIAISLLPAVLEYWRHRARLKSAPDSI